MNNLSERLLAAFQIEHKDHLEAVRSMLDACENAAGENGSLDFVEMHRRLHSLKGAARAVDMRPVETLAHSLEGLVEDCHAGLFAVDEEFVRHLREALDGIEDWVDAALTSRPPPSIDDISRKISLHREDDPHSSPALSTTRDEDVAPSPKLAKTAQAPELVRIEARSFDGLMLSSSEILTTVQQQEKLQSDLKQLQDLIRSLGRELPVLRRAPGFSRAVYDFGERASPADNNAAALFREIERQSSAAVLWQRSHVWRLRQAGRRLQSQMQSLRTIAAEAVFGGARKIVRDIARDQGKAVRVTVRGLETLADRIVLQSLKDPVLHLLRNAISHGIEDPAERRKASKPEEGFILLEIAARDSELVIRVEDDGRGVNRDRVIEVAREKGLLSTSAEIGDKALTSLLAVPGLSTAERVTEIAGRGIGLSVVKDSIARLGGEFIISPRLPHGVVAKIVAPASILTKRFLLVRASEGTYAIPTTRVKRVHHVPESDIEILDGKPHLLFSDAPPLGLASLSFLLGGVDEPRENATRLVYVLELEGAELRLGLIVDGIVEVREGFTRDLGLKSRDGWKFSAGIVLENGTVSPVLEVPELVDAFRRAKGGGYFPRARNEAGKRPRTILVVDDSITTRTLEKSVLETNGYHVRLSVDGADALRQLHLERSDLVISDIEMPNLDGFALVKAMKQDQAFSKIPIILVTSRNDDADRRRGLELGADAYVVKQRFDQVELLSLIDRLL